MGRQTSGSPPENATFDTPMRPAAATTSKHWSPSISSALEGIASLEQ
jgi:hypothetical protein